MWALQLGIPFDLDSGGMNLTFGLFSACFEFLYLNFPDKQNSQGIRRQGIGGSHLMWIVKYRFEGQLVIEDDLECKIINEGAAFW